MKIVTTRFGEMEIDERLIIYMPEGLVGFSDHKRYVILEHDTSSPFQWLQSVDDPDLAFIIVDPYLFKSDYQIELSPHEVASLETRDIEALICTVIVSIHRELPHPITANLQAPILINPENRWARQCILTKGGYNVRHDLLGEMRRPEESPGCASTLEATPSPYSSEYDPAIGKIMNPCGLPPPCPPLQNLLTEAPGSVKLLSR